MKKVLWTFDSEAENNQKVQWTFDSEAENNLKLVCVRLNENVPFHESFSRLSIVQTLRDLPSAFVLTKTLDSCNSCSKVIKGTSKNSFYS